MTEKSIDLSIIVPFYKGEQFLPRLLSSICESALLVKGDFFIELIVVIDSMETDVLLVTSVLDKTFREKVQIESKVIKNQINKGVAETRNEGKRFATGRFLTFIDQDDYVSSDYVPTLQKKLAPGCDFYLINGVFEYEAQKLQRPIFYYHHKLSFNKIAKSNFLITPGLLILSREMDGFLFRQFSRKHGGSDDWAFYLDLLSDPSIKYRYVSSKLLHYVVHKDNFHHNKFNFLISQIRTIQHYSALYPNNRALKIKINTLQFRLKRNLSMISLCTLSWNDFTGFLSLLFIELFSINNLIGLYWRWRTKPGTEK
ncbi:MAG: glycosyltransferase [Bacteroidales bacterium]|nr:glycosyltransferase [Bacteroidales bacterium]MDD4603593.1 glycosyltransferase [Bacteroidales bacterium]